MIRVIAIILLLATNASAACYCVCENGRSVPRCSSTYDVPPYCAYNICPLPQPRLKQIEPPGCRSEYVWTGYRYEWRRVCR